MPATNSWSPTKSKLDDLPRRSSASYATVQVRFGVSDSLPRAQPWRTAPLHWAILVEPLRTCECMTEASETRSHQDVLETRVLESGEYISAPISTFGAGLLLPSPSSLSLLFGCANCSRVTPGPEFRSRSDRSTLRLRRATGHLKVTVDITRSVLHGGVSRRRGYQCAARRAAPHHRCGLEGPSHGKGSAEAAGKSSAQFARFHWSLQSDDSVMLGQSTR